MPPRPRQRPRLRAHLLSATLLLAAPAPAAPAPAAPAPPTPATTTTPSYLDTVKPILTRHCAPCHGADQQKGGLRLDTAAAALRGGDAGPALVPGKGSQSLLIQVLDGSHATIARMPYKKPPLDPEDAARLRVWIDAGAVAPADEQPGRYVHWAFVPPRRQTPPPRAPSLGQPPPAHPIDAFIEARLARETILPSPPADRVTQLRRLHLDLTGLPPTPAEIDAFAADPRPDAYERRVDALLTSPHHGERWARWWLDAARYSDSNGYSIDAPRSIWPWRDWVVDALNADQPFDRFVIDQWAGDLLPDATPRQRIATGFHRNTQINQEGGIDPEQFRIESVIDRVNTTGTVLLGLTIACSQCHDHKFDPLPQREYYGLFAFLNNQDEPAMPVPTTADEKAIAQHDERLRDLERRRLAAATDTEHSRLASELTRLRKARPGPTTSLVLSERTTPRETFLFIKGDFTRRGPDIAPGTPAVLHPFRPDPPGDRPPNRLDLARWLVSPQNPLTARVTVNRVWQQYFGRGLVETENDFGLQGAAPSHPELLDWLAREFVDTGWSLRRLHRLIVTSATYRRSSDSRPDLADKDPTNRLLARQSRLRLDGEIIRDAALVASGQLQPILGGPPVHPPQPDGVMNLGQSRREWKPSVGSDRFRRALYTFHWRATPHPATAVFDAPDAFSACTRRPRSNTPLQALTLLNDSAFVELADALAARLLAEFPPDDRIHQAFRLCLSRKPDPTELSRLEHLVREEERTHGETAAWQTLARVLLNLDEAITRE